MSKEVFFDYSEFMVSKTDTRGLIKYVNKTFIDISGFSEEELIGKPHAIIRNAWMPRCIFKYFWDTIEQGQEMFAYVVNRCKNDDYYWVLAYVTPDLDPKTGKVVGYHSVRRVPSRDAVSAISELYAQLRKTEEQYSSKKEGMEASLKEFFALLEEKGLSYEEWIYSLEESA